VSAERLARRGIRARLGDEAARFCVASAGTASLDGSPMHLYTMQALSRLGADTSGFRSRQLTVCDIDQADLILSAGQGHRDQVLVMRPSASRRTYLLREFARLAAVISPATAGCAAQRARDVVAAAARLRGRVPYVDPAADEIADPAADSQAFLCCAQLIDGSVGVVLDALCGSLPAGPVTGPGR
jgi:protein-tyrosine phosphatase